MSPASTTDPLAPTASTAGRAWPSLGPASALLGVDPGTLRRWADEGRVTVYTTPGGHRRFDRRALERLASQRRPGMGRRTTRPSARPLAPWARRPSGSSGYTGGASATDAPADLVRTAVDDDDRAAYRSDGRRLVAALVAHLDADPGDGPGARARPPRPMPRSSSTT
jgi:excisionase family DNA binding protein